MNTFMSQKGLRILLGVLLVFAGAIFLLQQFVYLPVGALFIALLFAAGGAVFIFLLLQDHSKWWAVIPGYTLIGLGTMIAVSKLFPNSVNRFGGTIFLGFIALSFLTILLLKRDQWWPMIPAGVLATLALIAGLGNSSQNLGGALFFLGIGATFILVTLLPAGKNEKWAYIPGGICCGLGLLLVLLSGSLINSPLGWILALVFILGGAFLIFRSVQQKDQGGE